MTRARFNFSTPPIKLFPPNAAASSVSPYLTPISPGLEMSQVEGEPCICFPVTIPSKINLAPISGKGPKAMRMRQVTNVYRPQLPLKRSRTSCSAWLTITFP